MQRRTFRSDQDAAAVAGAVLCRDITVDGPAGRVVLRRGTELTDALRRLPQNDRVVRFEVVVPAADDLAQPTASHRLARAIAGPGVAVEAPHQGQVTLKAAQAGLLRVDARAVSRLNRSRAVLVATSLDGRVVEQGESVGIVKAPALFVAGPAVARMQAKVAGRPVVRVAPFRVRRVGLIAGERIRLVNLERSTPHLAAALAPFGAELAAVEHIPDDPAVIAATYRRLLADDVGFLLVAGSIVLDPGDPFLRALRRVGAKVARRGAPIEPGTMFWVAYAGDVPIFGLASCEMYGRLSILDLLLPYALAGEPITHELLADLGYGGLLLTTQSARR